MEHAWFAFKNAVKRWRCRHGLHRYQYHTTTDTTDQGTYVEAKLTDWCWCKWCEIPPAKVNVERRALPSLINHDSF